MISHVSSLAFSSGHIPSLSLLADILAIYNERRALAGLSAAQRSDLGLERAAIDAELNKPILQALRERGCR